MPKVYRQQYTKPIPLDAKRTTMTLKKRGRTEKVPAVRIAGTDGRSVLAPVVQSGNGAGTHCRVESPTYYGRVNGRPVSLETDRKDIAERALAKLLLANGPNADPFADEREKLLADHLADFKVHLVSKGGCAQHVEQTVAQIEAFLAGTGAIRIAELSLTKANLWLASLRQKAATPAPAGVEEFTIDEAAALLGVKPGSVRSLVARHDLGAIGQGKARRLPRETVCELLKRKGRGVSPETVNHYVRAVRTFTRWLVFPGKRHPYNPLDGLQVLPTATDRRRDRRDLSADELALILRAAKQSQKKFRGLSGEDRFHLYTLAVATGFRASGLASLSPAAFHLDASPPTVTLSASGNKAKKVKVQPIPPAAADLMRGYLKNRVYDLPVWPGTWASDRVAAQMLRLDLKDAGIPYAVQTPDGPRYADFHSLRHSYLTMLGRQGVDLRTVQELAGHSSPVLTARYSHRHLHDLSAAVGRLPDLTAPYEFLTNAPEDSRGGERGREGDDARKAV